MVTAGRSDDTALDAVFRRLFELAGPDPTARFGNAIRQSIDEVLDGPRTGRWDFTQLEKTEKTYVGTKIEIVIRASLELERGPRLDLEIEGQDLDTKWAMNSVWQIPREAVDELCLCIGGLANMTRFQVGVVRCLEEHLNTGENRDRKRTLSASGRAAMRYLVEPTDLPPNFLAELDPEIRDEAMKQASIQERVTTLFRLAPYTAIPRNAIATVARTTGDPMRRLRADTWAGDPLEGMQLLSAKYGNPVVEALGHPRMDADHWMAVPRRDIEGLAEPTKRALPESVRRRLGFG